MINKYNKLKEEPGIIFGINVKITFSLRVGEYLVILVIFPLIKHLRVTLLLLVLESSWRPVGGVTQHHLSNQVASLSPQ